MAAVLADRRGAAALEFALVAPVLVALGLGLAGSVRADIAAMDADAAASAAALVALEGAPPARVRAAARAAGPEVRVEAVAAIHCGRGRTQCAALPPGDYVRITVSKAAPLRQASTAIVRVGDGA